MINLKSSIFALVLGLLALELAEARKGDGGVDGTWARPQVQHALGQATG